MTLFEGWRYEEEKDLAAARQELTGLVIALLEKLSEGLSSYAVRGVVRILLAGRCEDCAVPFAHKHNPVCYCTMDD